MRILYINGEREYLTDENTLPAIMKTRRQSARVMMPLYGELQIRFARDMEFIGRYEVPGFNQYVGLFKLTYNRICYYFLENAHYFGAGKLYNPAMDKERFIFFSRSVASVLPHLDFKPEILHLKGWRTALIPLFLKSKGKSNIPTIFEMGNLWEQGGITPIILSQIPEINIEVAKKLKSQSALTFMGIGIEWCDYLLSQSPEMMRELLSPSSQVGMDGFFRSHREKIFGVTKGIDTKKWNPLKDETIIATFGKGDIRRRLPNRKWLLKELNLPENQPLIVAIDGAILPTTEFASVSETDAHYKTYLAGADFVITDIENIWQVMCYGAVPIIPRKKVLPEIISDISRGGNALIWGGEPTKEIVSKAAKIFSNRDEMLSLQRKVMDSVPSFADEYCDMLKLYNKILDEYIKS